MCWLSLNDKLYPFMHLSFSSEFFFKLDICILLLNAWIQFLSISPALEENRALYSRSLSTILNFRSIIFLLFLCSVIYFTYVIICCLRHLLRIRFIMNTMAVVLVLSFLIHSCQEIFRDAIEEFELNNESMLQCFSFIISSRGPSLVNIQVSQYVVNFTQKW